MKILMCEKEEILLTALEFRLQKIGFEVIRTKSEKELRTALSQHTPNLLVLDLNLPQFKGVQAIQEIKSKIQPKLPIIILSELGPENDILEAMDVGATDFVTKPFNPNELILRIQHILG